MVLSFPPFRSLSKSTSIKRFWPPHLRKHSIPLAYFTFLNPSCQQTLQQILVYCSPPHMPDHKLLEKRDLTIPFSAYLQGLQQDLAHSSWSINSFGINGWVNQWVSKPETFCHPAMAKLDTFNLQMVNNSGTILRYFITSLETNSNFIKHIGYWSFLDIRKLLDSPFPAHSWTSLYD